MGAGLRGGLVGWVQGCVEDWLGECRIVWRIGWVGAGLRGGLAAWVKGCVEE